ncbi:diguanylate cyclase [Bacterioplanes sanyensis]|uniref:GGDEF domain-containing response regulator n=1 Tax=Bacterioplanes sanyensis TaxID=1249553 RepID=UPI0018EEA508|nr:diguanylate cyclase [Bacterioplanes sanyensis]
MIHRSLATYNPELPLLVLAFGQQAMPPSLHQQLRAAGFSVKVVESISHLLVHKDNNACALLLNLDGMSEKQRQRLQRLASQDAQLPVIAFSADNQLPERLAAIRMGAVAFHPMPIRGAQVLHELKVLTERYEADPYNILIIEDQVSVASFYASTLEQAGFQANIISDPMADLMTYLNNNTPDLILLDLYLPSVTGQELAGIIRQQESLISVPIVFLSSEMSPQKQMQAMCTGGDAFLAKPVQPEDLLVAVESRVRRGRAVRNLVTTDPLTGVFNRREVLRRLAEELKRGQRFGSELCIAMVDLDHFKKINDVFGHAAGDQVIRHCAMMLSQQLQDSDLVGRLGGEEFLVLLPETPLEAACAALHQAARGIAQQPPLPTISYTFSVGVACNHPGDKPQDILNRADELMYQAKHGGRNAIVSEAKGAGD